MSDPQASKKLNEMSAEELLNILRTATSDDYLNETAYQLYIGGPAPDFELMSDTGQTVKLSDYRGKRVILYFYPKDDTH